MNSEEYPQRFSHDKYIEWHEKKIAQDIPLEKNLNNLREELKKVYHKFFEQVGQLLTQIDSHCRKEIRIQYGDIVKGENILPLREFSEEESSASYDTLFKPTKSIIDRLWRNNINADSNYISLSNIKSSIKDLARASVISPSLLYAKFFAERLKQWKTIIEIEDINKFLPDIKEVIVDDETKLASGYFAYHSTILLSDDNFIEIQIYSQLSSVWRNLSHVIYEKSRLGFNEPGGFGKTNTRLISLGHLLHLAECEIERIEKELLN